MQVEVQMTYNGWEGAKWVDLNGGDAHDIHNCKVTDIHSGVDLLVICPVSYDHNFMKKPPTIVRADTLEYYHKGLYNVVYSINSDVLEKEQ